jgi:hypothetical protein
MTRSARAPVEGTIRKPDGRVKSSCGGWGRAGILELMARGWESKAVEDQIGAAEAERAARARPQLSPADVERETRREGLLLARARIERDLETVRDERYRTMLARALEHVDAELAGL